MASVGNLDIEYGIMPSHVCIHLEGEKSKEKNTQSSIFYVWFFSFLVILDVGCVVQLSHFGLELVK